MYKFKCIKCLLFIKKLNKKQTTMIGIGIKKNVLFKC